MPNIRLDLSYSGIKEKEISEYEKEVSKIYKTLEENSKDEEQYVGWLKLPSNFNKKEFERIKKE